MLGWTGTHGSKEFSDDSNRHSTWSDVPTHLFHHPTAADSHNVLRSATMFHACPLVVSALNNNQLFGCSTIRSFCILAFYYMVLYIPSIICFHCYSSSSRHHLRFLPKLLLLYLFWTFYFLLSFYYLTIIRIPKRTNENQNA